MSTPAEEPPPLMQRFQKRSTPAGEPPPLMENAQDEEDGEGPGCRAGTVTQGNAFQAEFLAVENGLNHTWELGHQKLNYVTDCQDVVHALSEATYISSFWERELIYKIRSMLTWGWTVDVQYI